MSATNKINALGLVFLLIGIFSFAIPSYYIYAKGGTDDFYIVTSNVNGIETTEYNPAFVIGMLVFCYLFAIGFIVGGIYIIRKDIKSSYVSVESRYDHRTFRTHSQTDILPKIFIGLGALLIFIGLSLLAWDKCSISSLTKTEATVLKTYSTTTHNVSARRSTSRHYYAVIRYEIEGKEYTSKISVSEFFSDYEVTVYCDPANPLICRTANDFLLFYIVLFSVGAGFTFVGFFIQKHESRIRKEPY